jgi:hypothetical protein
MMPATISRRIAVNNGSGAMGEVSAQGRSPCRGRN